MYDIIKLKQKTMSTELVSWVDNDGRDIGKLQVTDSITGEISKTIEIGLIGASLDRIPYTVSKDGAWIAVLKNHTTVAVYNLVTGLEDKEKTVKLDYGERICFLYLTMSGLLLTERVGGYISAIKKEKERKKETVIMRLPEHGDYFLSTSVSRDESFVFLAVIYSQKNADDEDTFYLYKASITEEKYEVCLDLPEEPKHVLASMADVDIVFVMYHDSVVVSNVATNTTVAEFSVTPFRVDPSSQPVLSLNDALLFIYAYNDTNDIYSVNMYTRKSTSYQYDYTRIFNVGNLFISSFDITLTGNKLAVVDELGKLHVWGDTSSMTDDEVLTVDSAPGKVAFIPGRRRVKPAKIDREEEEEEEEEGGDLKRPKHSLCLKCMKEV